VLHGEPKRETDGENMPHRKAEFGKAQEVHQRETEDLE